MTQANVPEKTGHEIIQGYLKTIDSSPGVYRMLDAESRVLYVGKARNLRARVSNYARTSGHTPRISRMIYNTASMMFLTTKTETEALLLDYPQIKKHRGAKKEKGAYYGPFASAGAVNRTLNQLQRVFLLRDCSNAMFESRTRPCLQHQIKRCSAPCVGKITPEAYRETVRDAQRFLQGKTTDIQAKLAAEMARASEEMEFERAAALRDRIKALTQVQTIRSGQNWGNRDFYPRVGADVDAAEVLEAFIGQFYDTREPPRQLILSNEIENPDLMAEALTGKLGRKVELLVPQRGEKAELVDGALRNAKESLARKMAETATQSKLLQGLADAFDLPGPPERIEVYDNSHIQGTNAVGGMIVAGPEGMMRRDDERGADPSVQAVAEGRPRPQG